VSELRQDGTLTRLATQDDAGVLGQAVRVLEFLDGRPAGGGLAGDARARAGPARVGPIALPALAAQITGDTKALNHGTGLGTLVLRALALQAGIARPGSAAERRELWDRAGVLVDDLASRVLVLNLPAEGEGLGEWLAGAARYGTPFQVTLHQLATHPVKISCPRIFVCENPAVLRRACEELGAACPPLVCTEGRPSTAFHRLVGLAVAAGTELWYHGDFDWPGVAIAADVISRYGGRPWRMGASDYLSAASEGIRLRGEPVNAPWDPELLEAMSVTGYAVYEETLGDQLLADLATYGLRAQRPDGLPLGAWTHRRSWRGTEAIHRAFASTESRAFTSVTENFFGSKSLPVSRPSHSSMSWWPSCEGSARISLSSA
jgi:hypothetical protein